MENRAERVGGIVADGAVQRGIEALGDELRRIHAESRRSLLMPGQLERDIRSMIEHIFSTATVPDGEIYQVTELVEGMEA